MTEDQYAGIIASMYAQQADSDQMAAGVARLQSLQSAEFVALAVLIGFILVFGLIAAMQARPRAG